MKHLEHRVKNANIVLYLLKRNISPKISTNIKLGLYKSVILPLLVYGLQCVALIKTELTVLKTAKSSASPYVSTTERFFTAKKLTFEEFREPKLPERETKSIRAHKLLKTLKTRTENARKEFMFRTARIVNRLEKQIDFTKMIGLKIPTIFQNFSTSVNTELFEKNPQSRTSCLFCIRFTKPLTKIVAVKLLPFTLTSTKPLIMCLTLNY